ncbi:MAG: CinA family protein [Anaerolineales bacterium]|nr:CinA family protein [Anaerolineales bacterium]
MSEDPLEVQVGNGLRSLGWTLALGESCTGGLIGHRLTQVPGASDYFLGGVVAYAYDAKERLLEVRHQTLYDHGAVSRETALEMAHGARLAFGADVGLAVTGIAGPSGGLPGKPVGLTWIAVSTRQRRLAEETIWAGERAAVKEQSAEAALRLLLRVLRESRSPEGAPA